MADLLPKKIYDRSKTSIDPTACKGSKRGLPMSQIATRVTTEKRDLDLFDEIRQLRASEPSPMLRLLVGKFLLPQSTIPKSKFLQPFIFFPKKSRRNFNFLFTFTPNGEEAPIL